MMNKLKCFLQLKGNFANAGKTTLLFLCPFLLFACNSKTTTDKHTDTLTSGLVSISVDESFEPIIKQEIIVFENSYPDANIIPIYTNEVEAINLLLKDSVRLAIATRTLTESEKKYLENRKFFAREVKLATDGIAIIINNQNKDSLITVTQLRKIMTGEVTEWKEIYPDSPLGKLKLIFDNTNSSTVRFAIDSICREKSLSENLFAQQTNAKVIEYISNHVNAIGVIGVSWVANKADTTRLSFLDNVTLMSVSEEKTATPQNSYKPYQAYLALHQYPLTRDVYAILTDPRNGLPSGFLSFMSSDIGQKVILKEGIVPATQVVRIVNVKEDF